MTVKDLRAAIRGVDENLPVEIVGWCSVPVDANYARVKVTNEDQRFVIGKGER